jgi:hypothetical protein
VVSILVDELINSGSVREVPREFLQACSSIFAIPKVGSDKWRLITNLRNVNEFLVTETFKLPSLNSISTYLIPGWWAAKVDLTNAYGHLPLSERDIPYVGFQFRGRYFCHLALPFGLSVAPREWQRLMFPIIKHMRLQGCMCWVYLDDFLVLGKTEDEVDHFLSVLCCLLTDLGLEINKNKSVLEPTQKLIFLGFELDLKVGEVRVPNQKCKKVIDDLRRLEKASCPSIRHVASVLGRIRSLGFAIPHIRLLSDELDRHVGWHCASGWDVCVPLPPAVRSQLLSSMQDIFEWKGKSLHRQPGIRTVYTDASDLGWGVVAEPECPQAFGHFTEASAHHINVKEAMAAEKAILTLDIRSTRLHLYTDSTTLLWYILHWGGKSRTLNAQMRRLWAICQERDIQIIPHFVPSQLNPADRPSRRPECLGHGISLHPEVMDHLFQWAARLNIIPVCDWMASAENAQLRDWISPEQDWFRQDLRTRSPGWINPPHHLIPHVLVRMQRESPSVRAVLVVPHHPQAVWWQLLRPLMWGGASLLIPSQAYLYGQGHPSAPPGCYRGPLWCAIIQGGSDAPAQPANVQSSPEKSRSPKRRCLVRP